MGGYPRLRATVALAGLLAALLAWASLPTAGSPAPRWAWRFFAGWCVITPYWHYAEYRLVRGSLHDEAARADFFRQQGYSRAVWLGIGALFAVWLLSQKSVIAS